ncbi:PKD [Seminavis robusta]|uniref:PKD n=1 Tax=Seminavis robusta TaxID=568900 RepID=A0A9N8DYS3_9STRA|nr:PKD [Seminavis robusta]|eukprot:Sro453_g146240.1 PKD (527) ;mRNA; r:57953-59619
MMKPRCFATLLAVLAIVWTSPNNVTEAATCILDTPSTAASENPELFYVPNAPLRNRLTSEEVLSDPENVLVIEGKVLGNDCTPVPNVIIEVWYAGPQDGQGNFYSPVGSDLDHRGILVADDCGSFTITQTYPVQYLGSPLVHFRVSLPGDEDEPLLITEMYFEESLVAAQQPDYSQIVEVLNQDDGSRLTQFNMHVDIPGSGRLADCDVVILDEDVPAATTNPSVAGEQPGPDTNTHATSASGNGNCNAAHGHLPVMAAGGAPQNTLALTTIGTTVGGETAQHVDTCNGSNGARSPTSWFSVLGTGGVMTASTCWPGTDFDTKVSVFGGWNCTSLTCVASNDDSSTSKTPCHFNELASRATWPSIKDVEYTIMINGFGSRAGNFELSVETQNDNCDYAAPLAVGDRVHGDTTHAAVPWMGRGINQCPNGGVLVGSNRGLWWSVLGTGKRLEISTCNDEATLVATRLHVLESSCEDASTCIGGVYETDGCATFQWDTEPLVQYYVLVSSVVVEGRFALTLSEVVDVV